MEKWKWSLSSLWTQDSLQVEVKKHLYECELRPSCIKPSPLFIFCEKLFLFGEEEIFIYKTFSFVKNYLYEISLLSRERTVVTVVSHPLCKTSLRSVFSQCHWTEKTFFMDIRRNDRTSSETSNLFGNLKAGILLSKPNESIVNMPKMYYLPKCFLIWMMYDMFLSVRLICRVGWEQ